MPSGGSRRLVGCARRDGGTGGDACTHAGGMAGPGRTVVAWHNGTVVGGQCLVGSCRQVVHHREGRRVGVEAEAADPRIYFRAAECPAGNEGARPA